MYTNNNNGSFGGLDEVWGSDSSSDSNWDYIHSIVRHYAGEREVPKNQVDPESYIPGKPDMIDDPTELAPKILSSPKWLKAAPLIVKDTNPPPSLTAEPKEMSSPIALPPDQTTKSLGDWLGSVVGNTGVSKAVIAAIALGLLVYFSSKKKKEIS